jgi:hypothetical protein
MGEVRRRKSGTMLCIDDPLFSSIPFRFSFQIFHISLTFSPYINRLMKTRMPPVFHQDLEAYELPNYIPLIFVILVFIKEILSLFFFAIHLYRFEVSIFSFLLVLSYKAFLDELCMYHRRKENE